MNNDFDKIETYEVEIFQKKKEENGSHPWDIINSFMPGNFLQFCISHCVQKNKKCDKANKDVCDTAALC